MDKKLYELHITSKAEKQIKKIDQPTQAMLLEWINANLCNMDNPRKVGTELKGDKKGYWRYRVGDYRLLCEIQDDKVILLLLEAGHRRGIYKKAQRK